MAGKSLSVAKQQREKFLLEFKSAISDLEEELALSSSPDKQPNERKIKLKIRQVETTYKDCVDSHAQVNCLDKTTGTEDANWTWFNSNLRKPKKRVLDQAEEVLDGLNDGDNAVILEQAQLVEQKRKARVKLTYFEARSVGLLHKECRWRDGSES